VRANVVTRRFAPATGLILVAVVVVGFAVNAAIRMPCYDVCGSDIGRLYEARGIDRTHAPFFDRDLEYPPLTGLVMYAAGYPFEQGLRSRFLVNALILTTLAAVTTWLLWKRYGEAAKRWAFAPPLFMHGLTNWDLLAVAPATIGLLRWESGAALWAGVLLGAGAAAKLFPALYVPLLAASCIPRKRTRRAAELIAGAAGGFAVCAISVYAAAPDSLRHFLHFHGDRLPSRGTFWFYVFRKPSMDVWVRRELMVDISTIVPDVLVGAAVVVLTWYVARRRLAPLAACGLATIVFILTNKIYSPQYDLWLVPFLVMLPVRTKLVVHFYVASALVFILTATEGHVIGRPFSLYVLASAVAYRLVVVCVLGREILRVPECCDLEGRDIPTSAGGSPA
jgi:hypothetical protein